MKASSNILFLTGTRADFGKLKPLILSASQLESAKVKIFATGMHLQPNYGLTIKEVEKLGIPVFPFVNFSFGDSMSQVVSKTVSGLADYLRSFPIDFLVIHGDRSEALAGAIVGSLNNVRVIHVEGGELSGTVDESLRHAITKLSHIHLVSNEGAKNRVVGLGENPKTVFEIGSPELDIMFSDQLPTLIEVRQRYELTELKHCIFVVHPVTTQEPERLAMATREILTNLLSRGDLQVVAILPNNDNGAAFILSEIERHKGHPLLRVIPSMRFEHYLSLLKAAEFIIGNSSSGVREAPAFGTPSLNIGSRQSRRAQSESIIDIDEAEVQNLSKFIDGIQDRKFPIASLFGDGRAADRFLRLLADGSFYEAPLQKQFYE